MNPGDLVKRKPEFGEWVKNNPWMHTKKDFEIGMVIKLDTDLVVIHWPTTGPSWEWRNELLSVKENHPKRSHR